MILYILFCFVSSIMGVDLYMSFKKYCCFWLKKRGWTYTHENTVLTRNWEIHFGPGPTTAKCVALCYRLGGISGTLLLWKPWLYNHVAKTWYDKNPVRNMFKPSKNYGRKPIFGQWNYLQTTKHLLLVTGLVGQWGKKVLINFCKSCTHQLSWSYLWVSAKISCSPTEKKGNGFP